METRSEIVSPVGLLAGNGYLPLEFARSARDQGLEVIAVAHRGETMPELEELVSRCVWVKVGELGKILRAFRNSGVRQVAFAGGIKRVRLFRGDVRPDLAAVRLMARLRSVKDDVLLRGVAEEIERDGIRVIPAGALLKESKAPAGPLTRRTLTREEARDAAIGWEAAKAIGRLDIGQTVLVAQGLVVAVEAVEGTDAAISRGGSLAGRGAVVVKVAKPQQDLRMDLPAVGPKTITTMAEAGATALVVEENKSVLLYPAELARLANENRIAVHVARSEEELRHMAESPAEDRKA